MRFPPGGGNFLRAGTVGRGEFDGRAGWFPGTFDAVNPSVERKREKAPELRLPDDTRLVVTEGCDHHHPCMEETRREGR